MVYFVSVNLLQMMDLNGIVTFPVAPLFTVILSLVGKMIKTIDFHFCPSTDSNHDVQIYINKSSKSLYMQDISLVKCLLVVNSV